MEDICSWYSHRCKNLRFSRQSEWHSASQVYEGFGHLKNHLWLWWKLQLQQLLPLHQVLSQTSWCKLEPGSGSCQDACECFVWRESSHRLYFWASLAQILWMTSVDHKASGQGKSFYDKCRASDWEWSCEATTEELDDESSDSPAPKLIVRQTWSTEQR